MGAGKKRKFAGSWQGWYKPGNKLDGCHIVARYRMEYLGGYLWRFSMQ